MKSRRASRIIVVNRERQILLFKYSRSTSETYWAPPGGGLQQDETYAAAAAREAAEELGLDQLSLTPLWESTIEFNFGGHPVRQDEAFFLLRVRSIEFTERVRKAHAEEGILQARWWSIAEIESTHEVIFPEALVDRLRRIESLD